MSRPSACRRGYDRRWRAIVRDAIEVHVRLFGWACPGWGVPAHHSSDLTGDHELAFALGGRSTSANVQILCRGCNSRKGRQPAVREQLSLELGSTTQGSGVALGAGLSSRPVAGTTPAGRALTFIR